MCHQTTSFSKSLRHHQQEVRLQAACSPSLVCTDVSICDTLWASGYEMFERLSQPVQNFLQTLTVTFRQPLYRETAMRNNFDLYQGPRGSPDNTNQEYEAIHPLIRTNPVTGRKSIFAFGQHLHQVNQVTESESNWIINMIQNTLTDNHDLQVGPSSMHWLSQQVLQLTNIIRYATNGLRTTSLFGITVRVFTRRHTTTTARV